MDSQGISLANCLFEGHETNNLGDSFPHQHCILATHCGKGCKRICVEQMKKALNHIINSKCFHIHIEKINKSEKDFKKILNYTFNPNKIIVTAYKSKVKLLKKIDGVVKGYLTDEQWKILAKQLKHYEYDINGYPYVVYHGVLTEGMLLRVKRWIAENQSQGWYPSTK